MNKTNDVQKLACTILRQVPKTLSFSMVKLLETRTWEGSGNLLARYAVYPRG